jgi:hypothetical protein
MKAKRLFFSLIFSLSVIIFSCNKPPDIPVCIYPVDGATNITDSILVLSWSAFDEDGDKLFYDVSIAKDTMGGTVFEEDKIAENIETTTYSVSNLMDTTKYYWVVSSQDGTGDYNIGMWSFTTGIIEK